MQISTELREKILERLGKSAAEIRFFTGPDSEGPERTVGGVIAADVVGLSDETGPTLVTFKTLAEAWIPWKPPAVARWLDVTIAGVRISRLDLAHMLRGAAHSGDVLIPADAQFTLEVST